MAATGGGWEVDVGSGYAPLDGGRAGLPSRLLGTLLRRRSSEPAPWLYLAGSGLGATLGAAIHTRRPDRVDDVPLLARVAVGAAAGAGVVWLVFASTAVTTPFELLPLRAALRDVLDPAGRDERELSYLGSALRRAGLRVVLPVDDQDAEVLAAGRSHGPRGLHSAGFVCAWPDRSLRIEVATDHEQALTDARLGVGGHRRRERDTTLTIDDRVVPARTFAAPDGDWAVVAAFERQAVTVSGQADDDIDPVVPRLRTLPLGELPSVSTSGR